jgi:hypothetical protein
MADPVRQPWVRSHDGSMSEPDSIEHAAQRRHLPKKPSTDDWGGGLGEILQKKTFDPQTAQGGGVGTTLEEILASKRHREAQEAAQSQVESQNLALLLANRPRRQLRSIASRPPDGASPATLMLQDK